MTSEQAHAAEIVIEKVRDTLNTPENVPLTEHAETVRDAHQHAVREWVDADREWAKANAELKRQDAELATLRAALTDAESERDALQARIDTEPTTEETRA